MKKLTKEEMIDYLVRQDIDDIRQAIFQDDIEFLDRALRGKGWKPYNQLSKEYINQEYKSRLPE
jgi:hypothetical protein